MPYLTPGRVTVTVVSAAVGLAFICGLAMFFQRRKRRKATIYLESPAGKDVTDTGRVDLTDADRWHKRNAKQGSLNGDVHSVSHASSPATLRRSPSVMSGKSDADSASTVIASVTRGTHLSPLQLLEVGMEMIYVAKGRWELALRRLEDAESLGQDGLSSELHDHLSQLLELVDRVRMAAESRAGGRTGLLNQVCTSAALDAALDEMDREYELQRRRLNYSFDDASSSDLESFVSALDMADLSDLEDQKETFQHLGLYEAALLELSHGSVPCRALRTKMVRCSSDTEFFAKLHCIRLAFTELLAVAENREFFISVGRDLISSLLLNAQKDADDFFTTYDEIIAYVNDRDNWSDMEEELRNRGVKMLTFYDVVIDFIFFDAFDDLESPPATLTSVMQNRWLTAGFKEMALSTAVWSVLKAKRQMLQSSKGFIAHFYAVSETVSPMLAWGFLGPDSALKDMCYFFKDQFLEYMWDIFSFDRVRYTTVEHLAEDIMRLARRRAASTTSRLSSFTAV